MTRPPLEVARGALAGRGAWLVGGALRDRLLGRPTVDLDVVVPGDVAGAAHDLARSARAAVFPLSDRFGAWRVVDRDRAWHVDLSPLAEEGIEADLGRRDLTVNAIAEPLDGGELRDPFGGREDLAAGRLRAVGPRAFADDPLRVMRVARLAGELALRPDPATVADAHAHAAALDAVSPERVFGELKRLVAGPDPLSGLALMHELGATAVVLPELEAGRGVAQGVYHHLDVHDHTLAVLEAVLTLERDPAPALGEHAEAVAALLAEPLGDELTRGHALRLGALLHDIAKPRTRWEGPDGRVGFPGHDAVGAQDAAAILGRLRASARLREHVAALTRHHLRLGFLVHERPLERRAVYRYLRETAPVEIDVTVLTVADRLATRGRKAPEAIARHLDLARELLGEALAARAAGPSGPLIRGDELAAELGIRPGPELGRLLALLEEARFAGEVRTRDEAVARARALLEG